MCYNISMKKTMIRFVKTEDICCGNVPISPVRRGKYESIKNEDAKRQYLASSEALYLLLGDKAMSFYYGKNGSPCVDGGYVSCAHTEGIAMCAFSDAPMGCDIEKTGRVLSGKMKTRFGNIREWLALEACVKMTGEGLAGIKKYRRSGDAMLDEYGKQVAHVRFLEFGEYSAAVCCGEEFEVIM